ncbi:MAG: glycosyltransferase family 2 protein [Alphaproteobacteria bacterium]|nr:glycosyltransferase family 2 protein [Alphaproteobacteria bacterium]
MTTPGNGSVAGAATQASQPSGGSHAGRAPAVVAAEIPAISLVVPIYKEEKTIRMFLERVEPALDAVGSYEILFCYDPSPDRTKEILLEEMTRNPRIRMLEFSRRFGQPSAIMAGIHHCVGDTCVVIDVDLQDPPELICELHRKLKEGYDVVLARRRRRESGEPLIRRLMSFVGYRVINALADIEIPPDTGEFRIMNRRVIDELSRLKERNGFLRGLVAFVGFRQAIIEFDRTPRAAGTSNYHRYIGSIKIGLNGVIGFSNTLLTATLMTGIVIAGLAFLVGLYVGVMKLALGEDYPAGLPTLIVLLAFLGGMQLVAIGILGEYVGRIYDEVKQRPPYIVHHFLNPPALPDNVHRLREQDDEHGSVRSTL